MHEERDLPNCILPTEDPFYHEWTKLDDRLDKDGREASFKVNNELIPVLQSFAPDLPGFLQLSSFQLYTAVAALIQLRMK